MNIGIPKERRPFEYRVGMTPAGVQLLSQEGHTCYVEHDAGLGAGFSDQDYEQAGARIVYSPHEVFGRADLLLKVARPVFEELNWLQPGAIVAGLLHLSSARTDKIDLILDRQITAVGYEHIQMPDGTRPVRRSLSQIGGRLAALIGARLLQNNAGGKGILIGGVAGVPPAEVVVIGAGIAGTCASQAFSGMGAHVTAIDNNINALQTLYARNPHITTMVANPYTIARACAFADLVVSAVYREHDHPEIVVSRDMIRAMKPRSVVMDLSIDEGGSLETSRPTTHERSTYIEEGVIHYCVPNIPSIVARTSTYAFLNEAFPYIQEMARCGIECVMQDNQAIQSAVHTYKGSILNLSGHSPTGKTE